jgi:hypothetical protein
MDLAVTYGLFNLGLFLALVVIASGRVSMGVGFGLFAVCRSCGCAASRSPTASWPTSSWPLVLALVCAIDLGDIVLAGVFSSIAVLATWVVDHPRLSRPSRQIVVMLEHVFEDHGALRRHLEGRLNAQVTDVSVLELDYLRETTRVAVSYRAATPDTRPVPEEALHADIAVARR